VSIQLRSSDHCGQLQDWLSKHADVVVSLNSWGEDGSWSPLQVPVHYFVRLRSLNLGMLKLQLAQGASTGASSGSGSSGGASGGSSDVAVLPELRQLCLCRVQLSVQLLSQLLRATGLTKLDWGSVRVREGLSATKDPLQQEQVWSLLWQHLPLRPKLSELQLQVQSFTAAAVTPLSTLQRLQHLSICVSINPGMDALTCQEDARALLTALRHLTQLRHLELVRCQLFSLASQPQQQECFSALTASTQLMALAVRDIAEPVPQAAFGEMFPPGLVLPNLTVLRLDGMKRRAGVGAAQVAMIAASCPGLREMSLKGGSPAANRRFFDASCLSQLPAGVTRVEGIDWVRRTR
jgi:hypothetical protein